jgi:membrane protein
MEMLGYRLGPLLKKTGQEILADRVSTLAAQTAYYFFFSLFPLLLFLGPLLALVVEPETLIAFVIQRATLAMPAQAVGAVELVLRDVVFVDNAPGLMSLGLLFAAWSGSNIFGALMTALNTAYDVEETRPWWKRQLLRLGMLMVGGVVLFTATVLMLAGEDIARAVGSWLGAAPGAVAVWSYVQYPVALAFVVLLAFLTYWLLPNVAQKKGRVLAVAVVASVLWVGATLLFRLYVQHFPPNPAYGLIGAVMILMTWMYYTMFVVLAGGELASELHHGAGAVTPPKGATLFGRIVSGEEPGRPSIPSAS